MAMAAMDVFPIPAQAIMADEALTNEQVAEMRKRRTFRKFTFRGVDLDKLLDLSMEVIALSPPRRRMPSM